MNYAHPPLIVGAGPVGLSAGLFLARQGQKVRIIDRLSAPSRHSKALAVNPRTLELLEPTGVTDRILEDGLAIHGVHVHEGRKVIAQLSFEHIHPKFPFMIALSQASTERLLADALATADARVERSVQLVECRNIEGGAEVALEPMGESDARDVFTCPWVLAADGAHSTVRERLKVAFDGSSFRHDWYLADAPMRTDLAEDRAHLLFMDDGSFQFMVRVVDKQWDGQAAPVWRVIGNRPDPLHRLTHAEPAGEPVWTSAFGISHRLATPMMLGAVYFAGDAAHIHSPVGARGMNLGIEDAWVFAELVRTNALLQYERMRRPVDHQVVRRVRQLSRLASGETAVHRLARRTFLPKALRVPMVRSRMLATVTGLDHDQRWGFAAAR